MRIPTRLQPLSTGIFTELAERKQAVLQQGRALIDLSIGSPDLPPPAVVVDALTEAARDVTRYGYTIQGLPSFNAAVAEFYANRYGVSLDPSVEVLQLMGSQEGLAHLSLALIDPGDVVLVPDPGYPIYHANVLIAQGRLYPMPLRDENGFLPDLDAIPESVLSAAKLMILSYPGNPVTALCDASFFERVIAFAKRHDIIVVHDFAYSELVFDGVRPVSFLSVPGAKEVGIEFYSLSKTYNMAGCRIGFAVGNSDVLAALALIKSNIDYGVFYAVQEAGIAALTGPQDCVAETARTYQRRRDILVDGLGALGWHMPKPQASMFVWAPLPPGYTSSTAFSADLLEKAGVIVIPGVAFGKQGEGYVRIALVKEEAVLAEVVNRVRESFRFR
ncbi:MAG: aminotransferase class I/II-fold pyridoxal phosphate-dependent enzyme [Alicyclobacillus sp.]|nr:aminotransferase class I/II-fold pyridoxal phosphate-dependent enzyme [Alicyclobacillus sp.]